LNASERDDFHRDFEHALAFVTQLHARQVRKQTDIPYISHLIAVAGLVLENGGGRDQAIAALLHDAIEDQGPDYEGGPDALRRVIAQEFGANVLEIVEGCTDSDQKVKGEYRSRKQAYVEHLEAAPPRVLLVSCADKLHNARAIVADLRIMGPALFERFNGGRDGTLWYYGALADVFDRKGPKHLSGELRRTVDTLKDLAG
jgi:(p)ppGpp synthase/HD superfamily hydrolase